MVLVTAEARKSAIDVASNFVLVRLGFIEIVPSAVGLSLVSVLSEIGDRKLKFVGVIAHAIVEQVAIELLECVTVMK